MTWFDRSAWRARRWWDRAARRHARQESKIPGHDRSFCFLLVNCRRPAVGPRGGLIGGGGGHASSQWMTVNDNRVRKNRRQGDQMPLIQLGNDRAWVCRDFETIVSRECHDCSFLVFAAWSEAAVVPPPTLVRFSESRMPCVGIGARLEEMVRELTPIHEISDDNRPHSIFGQRFITTLMPTASAFSAAASSRPPSCIQITFGSGESLSASSTTGIRWAVLLKISTISTGCPISASEPTNGRPSRLLPTWPGLTGIMS